MGVISIRLNNDEEKVLKKLSDYFHEDKSTLIKKSLVELYEKCPGFEYDNEIRRKRKKGKGVFYHRRGYFKRINFLTHALVYIVLLMGKEVL